MAKKPKEGSESKATQVTRQILDSTAENYDALKQKVSDAAMKVASCMKTFENIGGNNKAFKLARWCATGNKDKVADFLRTFHMYLVEFGVYDQCDMLDEVPEFNSGEKKHKADAPEAPRAPTQLSAAAH